MTQSISFNEAVSLAKSGDVQAQYAVSSVLHQRGQFDESLHWLRLAAGQNLAEAQMSLAIFLIDGRRCPRDLQQAINLLQPLAATHNQANQLLSELHGFAVFGIADRQIGLRFLFAAARKGDASALRQLALLSVCYQRWDLVRPLLDSAARRGDSAAAYALARCYAEGFGGTSEPAIAAMISNSELMHRQYLGQRLSQDIREQQPLPNVAVPMPLNVDWQLLEEALPQFAAEMPLPSAEILSASPLIRKFVNAIHSLVLDALINLAAPLVQRSQIVDATTGEMRADPMRTSSHITFGPRQHDHVLETIERLISNVTGLPPLHGEFLQILRYRLGEEFRPHVDYFNDGGAGTYQSLADGGQRAQTVLLYLNDDYTGGSTQFPKLNLEVKGQRGDLLHFHNLHADGIGNRDTLHAGLPIISGEKWLLSQWIRSESYRPRVAW